MYSYNVISDYEEEIATPSENENYDVEDEQPYEVDDNFKTGGYDLPAINKCAPKLCVQCGKVSQAIVLSFVLSKISDSGGCGRKTERRQEGFTVTLIRFCGTNLLSRVRFKRVLLITSLQLYQTKGNLTRHLKYECGKQAALKCPLCGTQTKYKSSMRRHILNRHPGYDCTFDDQNVIEETKLVC